MKYLSPLPWHPPRLHAAAVYCSDGRVGEHFDDFLQNGLGLPNCDRVVLPGGCACIAGHEQANVQAAGVAADLRFLVEAHGLERIVLIAHQGCAFYSQALDLPDGLLEGQQRIDLQQAARRVRAVTGVENVEGWFLRITGTSVAFEQVPLV